jgi:hypothetical protein
MSSRELKQAEHFEDDDDNDNDSDDVEDVSVHEWWITRRYRRRQARLCDLLFLYAQRCLPSSVSNQPVATGQQFDAQAAQ